jgi:hypothetical protein
MGCNCKGGKVQVLNNLNSKDHLNLAFMAYEDVVSKYDVSGYTEADAHQVINAFYSIYPNVKTKVTIEHASSTIKHIYDTQYGK